MLKIDDNLLQEIGLGSLPAEEKRGLLSHIYETLEMRVGMRLADQMTNEQLDEFEQYFEAKDDAGAFKWLETNFPNYKEIVNEEFEKLKAEVAQTTPNILAAAQSRAVQGPSDGGQQTTAPQNFNDGPYSAPQPPHDQSAMQPQQQPWQPSPPVQQPDPQQWQQPPAQPQQQPPTVPQPQDPAQWQQP